MPLTDDHKAAREDETARVEAAGGQILFWNGVRVMGVLAVSRAIGDHCLAPVRHRPARGHDPAAPAGRRAAAAGRDGLWDVLSNAEAVTLARRCVARASAARGDARRPRPHRRDGADAGRGRPRVAGQRDGRRRRPLGHGQVGAETISTPTGAPGVGVGAGGGGSGEGAGGGSGEGAGGRSGEGAGGGSGEGAAASSDDAAAEPSTAGATTGSKSDAAAASAPEAAQGS